MGCSDVDGASPPAGPASRWLSDLCIRQDHAAERLLLCRLTTGAAVLRTVWHLPTGTFLATYQPLVEEAAGTPGTGRAVNPLAYEALRGITVVSAGAWMLGARHPAVRIAANVSFALLQRQVVKLDDSLYSYNSHLNVFLGLLSLADDPEKPQRPGSSDAYASALLAAMQAYYAAMYLQSGISKLATVGWKWTHGRTLQGAWAELGTPAGKRLSAMNPKLAQAASTGALLYELAFAPALLAAWRHRALLGLSSAAFHGAVKATMNISFWHLSWFSAPLFAVPDKAARGYSQLLSTGRRGKWPARGIATAGALVGAAPLVKSWLKRRAGSV